MAVISQLPSLSSLQKICLTYRKHHFHLSLVQISPFLLFSPLHLFLLIIKITMFRISNNLLRFLNIFSMLVSFVIIGFSLYIVVINGTSECEKVFFTPSLVLGIFFLVISVLGLVGSCCRITFLLWLYLALMFFLILGLFAFTVFMFIVTNNGAGKALSRRGYSEYKLDDYSNWVRKHVTNERNWQKVKSCLVQMKVCRSLGMNMNQNVSDFNRKSLTPL